MRCPPDRPNAFTLTEWLLVTAVLGVILALALPVLRTVRMRTADARCLSHLRTLGTAYNLYRADYHGMGPPSFVGNGNRALFPFNEGHSYNALHSLRYYYRTGPRYVMRAGSTGWITEPIEYCPSVQLTGIADWSDERFGSHYAMIPGNTRQQEDGTYVHIQADLRQAESHSEIPILWDSWSGNFEWSLPLRHNGSVNVAFLDGHVGSIPQTAEDGRLYRNWWNSAVSHKRPNPAELGRGERLGRTSR